ncbi:hypothetical protein [Burkholderia arboris]|uniref:Uncharacterized protein n=1 Tax=Burkholderia arboris TaxID=488730 RepID=A0ABZ3DVS1_9BURK|nr:hypothetical protein [Burkholderia arboris]WDZ28087.1 hypothetical protein NLX30_39340 [Burkholderia arboris]
MKASPVDDRRGRARLIEAAATAEVTALVGVVVPMRVEWKGGPLG